MSRCQGCLGLIFHSCTQGLGYPHLALPGKQSTFTLGGSSCWYGPVETRKKERLRGQCSTCLTGILVNLASNCHKSVSAEIYQVAHCQAVMLLFKLSCEKAQVQLNVKEEHRPEKKFSWLKIFRNLRLIPKVTWFPKDQQKWPLKHRARCRPVPQQKIRKARERGAL